MDELINVCFFKTTLNILKKNPLFGFENIKPIGECTPTKIHKTTNGWTHEVCGHKYGKKWVCSKTHATIVYRYSISLLPIIILNFILEL